jgi:superfamily II DNA or RNA helicase
VTTRVPHVRRGELVRIRGECWRVAGQLVHSDVAVVDVVGCGRTNRAKPAQFLFPFEPFDRLETSRAPRVVSPARWRHVARRTLAEVSPSWPSLQAATDADLSLIPFQLEPALALMRGEACRFLIADAVGLGKTVEAGLMIAEMLRRRPDAKALVIAPAGLRHQWRDELKSRFALEADIVDAATLARATTRLPAGANPWSHLPLIITSIDYIKRPEVIRSVETLIWDVVVLDEAHHLAGRSDRAATAAMLGDRARLLVLLTATPHSGDVDAFSRLCSIGDVTGRDTLAVFRRTREDAGLPDHRRTTLLRVRPTPEEAAMHDALLAYARAIWAEHAGATYAGARLVAAVLARRASSSAGSLARSIERRLASSLDVVGPVQVQSDLPFGEPEDEEPDAVLKLPGLADPDREHACLARLLELARVAARAESKVTVLRRLLSRINEPAIVFTEYRDTLQRIADALSDLEVLRLHGGLSVGERADVVRRFTSGTAGVLIATDAGSEGLNLHHRCRLAINLELPWTPLRLEQRAGRVDRVGQRRRVHVLHLVAAGTCEESTLARLVQRVKNVRGALSLLTRVPNEQQVATAILGHGSEPDLTSDPGTLPRGLVMPDLRHDAIEEARRLAQARAFARASPHAVQPGSIVARVCRRRSPSPPQAVWLYKLAFVTTTGTFVHETLVSVRAELTRRARNGESSTIRALLDPNRPALQQLLAVRRGQLLDELHASMAAALRRWTMREADVSGAMRARHARLAAGLLQRSLFDSRDERLAASQAALLDEALSQSAARLRELEVASHLRVDSCELTFAVLLE